MRYRSTAAISSARNLDHHIVHADAMLRVVSLFELHVPLEVHRNPDEGYRKPQCSVTLKSCAHILRQLAPVAFDSLPPDLFPLPCNLLLSVLLYNEVATSVSQVS